MRIKNPELDDFEFSLLNDDNTRTSYKIPGHEVVEFDDVVGLRALRRLKDFCIMRRGVKKNWPLDAKELEKEILV